MQMQNPTEKRNFYFLFQNFNDELNEPVLLTGGPPSRSRSRSRSFCALLTTEFNEMGLPLDDRGMGND